MKKKNQIYFSGKWLGFLIALGMAACNKNLPEAIPIEVTPLNSNATTIGELIGADTSYSFYAAAASLTGQLDLLGKDSTEFTVFLPDNNAFRAAGIPTVEALLSLPPEAIGALIGYTIIPGQQLTRERLPTQFPNVQLPTSLTIGQLPGTPLPVKLTTFLSVAGSVLYNNTIPVLQPEIKLKNGIVDVVARLVTPPSSLMKEMIYHDPDLSYFRAAVARADSGQTGLDRLDSLLGYPLTNMTVLVPDNDAFKDLVFGTLYAYFIGLNETPTAASQKAGALASTPEILSDTAFFGIITASKVRGILAYHILATPNPATGTYEPNIRAFSNNFSTSFLNYTTMVNSEVPLHPGIGIQVVFTGPFVTSLQFTGLGTFPPGGPPYSGPPASAIRKDQLAVNGIYHVIDKVLLPQ